MKSITFYKLLARIVDHPGLNGHHHTLHAILYTRCQLNNGRVKLSREWLADKLQCSVRSISSYLDALAAADQHFHFRRTGRSNLFWFTDLNPLFSSDVQNLAHHTPSDVQGFAPLTPRDLQYFAALTCNELQDTIYKVSLRHKFRERTGRDLSTARASELTKWERNQLFLHRLSIDEETRRFWAPVFTAEDWVKNSDEFFNWSYSHYPTPPYRAALANSPWIRNHKQFCIKFFIKHAAKILAGKYEKQDA